MSDAASSGGSPRQVLILLLLLAGGGYYFFSHYEVDGLESLSLNPKTETSSTLFRSPSGSANPWNDHAYTELVANTDPRTKLVADTVTGRTASADIESSSVTHGMATDPFEVAAMLAAADNPAAAATPTVRSEDLVVANRIRHGTYANLHLGSWALDGFGPTKLANRDVRSYFARVARQFDVLAVQQVAAMERDVVPRLVDELNAGDNRYDFVLSRPTGPAEQSEMLAFIFDTTTVEVDRRNSYTLDDPENRFVYDPFAVWFRATAPPAEVAWTFTMVNLRLSLHHAAAEVAALPDLMRNVAADGRGEDDVVLCGLFQADDAYLGPTMNSDANGRIHMAVRQHPTDVFGRYQTANLLLDGGKTTEYLGRGGVLDVTRLLKLRPEVVESLSSHLPVRGVFTAHEGGGL